MSSADKDIERQTKEVEVKITEVEKEIKACSDTTERKQLRDKERQLREEKLILLQKQNGGRGELGPQVSILPHSLANPKVTKVKTDDERDVELWELPNGAKWPYLEESILFVRDFYPSFYDRYFGHYGVGTKLIVLGTPGIGKSSFGLYCISRALQAGKTVVYQSSKARMYSIYKGDTLQRTTENPIALLDDHINTVYICDGETPQSFLCPTILVTSPKRDVWYEYSKAPRSIRKTFGKWNRGNELDLLRQHCFPTVSKENMDKRVHMWGEIPRIILTNPNNFRESLLMSLIAQTGGDLLMKALMLHEDKATNPTHFLIHLVPDEEFNDSPREFASDFVAFQVFLNVEKQGVDVLSKILSTIGEEGYSFASGLQVSTIELSEKPLQNIDKLSDAEVDKNAIYIPNSETFPALDWFTFCRDKFQAFNATVNSKHSIFMDTTMWRKDKNGNYVVSVTDPNNDKDKGLYRYWNSLNNQNMELEFYCVVPDKNFQKQEMPQLLWKGKENDKSKKRGFEGKFKYYALNIPIPSSLQQTRQFHLNVRRFLGKIR